MPFEIPALPIYFTCSLKNHGAEAEVNKMFDLGAEAMQLPLEEKLKFDQGTDGASAG
jgi:hypothetical protein